MPHGLAATLIALAAAACSGPTDATVGIGGASSVAGASGGGAAGSSSSASAGSGGTAGSSDGGFAGSGAGRGAQGGTAGCQPAGSLICDSLRPFPASIVDTGVYTALPDTTRHHARALSFEPNPALWSDGLAKERFVIVPAGASIDNSAPQRWQFPLGTIFVKSFYDDGGVNGSRRPIETRFIRRSPDPADPFSEWEFAVYQWNSAGTDAVLVSFDDPMRDTPVEVIVSRLENGKRLEINAGEPFMHSIPGKQQCQACHDANAKVTGADIIGFDELRLGWKREGDEQTQLATLVERRALTTLPGTPASIAEADPVLRRVKAWAYGNCVHCHNGAEGMLDLRPDVFVQNTVNMAAEGAGIMVPDATWKRVVPKQPERSVLFVQARRTPLPSGPGVQMRAMPPLGVAAAEMSRPNAATDPPGGVGQVPPLTLPATVPSDPIADLAAWINGL